MLLRWALEEIQREDGRSVYFRLSTRPIDQPERDARRGADRGDRRRRVLAARAGARRRAGDRLLRRGRAGGAGGARGDRWKTCRAPDCWRSPRPDALHRDWQAVAGAPARPGVAERLLARLRPGAALVTVTRRPPGDAVVARRGGAATPSSRSASTGSANPATSRTSTASTGSTRRHHRRRGAGLPAGSDDAVGRVERSVTRRPSRRRRITPAFAGLTRPTSTAPRYCGPPRIEAGCPGSFSFCPVSVSLSPSTFRIETSWSIKLPT